jgi:hypothetical protein
MTLIAFTQIYLVLTAGNFPDSNTGGPIIDRGQVSHITSLTSISLLPCHHNAGVEFGHGDTSIWLTAGLFPRDKLAVTSDPTQSFHFPNCQLPPARQTGSCVSAGLANPFA